jgi:hypothetical protein
MTPAGFPHSGTLGSKPARRLPEAIAANSALHRLLAPGHPPCALTSLKRTNYRSSCIELARSHASSDDAHDQHLIRLSRFATEGPGDVIRPPRLGDEHLLLLLVVRGATKTHAAHPAGSLRIRPSSPPQGSRGVRFLLRKEVIQPHLPVRLPCYDFTPIIDPTLDGSLPCGLGHRLRVKPTLVV